MTQSSVLAELVERLDADDPECSYRVGRPGEPGWFVLGDTLADPSEMDAWTAAVSTELTDGHVDVAGSYLAAFLAVAVAVPVAAAVRRERRAWPVDLGTIVVHRHREGWLDGVALMRPDVWALADDAAAADPDIEILPDLTELRSVVAGQITAAMSVAFAAVRRSAPYGTAGMWGQLADELARAAEWDARRRGTDPTAAFTEAMALVDGVAARASLLRARPHLCTVDWSGGVAHTVIRGTCCLYYKTQSDPDPRGDGYCGTCPLRDPSHQLDLLREWLDEEAAETVHPDSPQPEERP